MSIHTPEPAQYGTMSPAEEAMLPPAPRPEQPLAPRPEPQPEPVTETVVAPLGGKVITLPSGFKVALRGTRSIRNRDRASIFEGADFENGSKVTAGFTLLSNIVKLLIVSWDVRDFDEATGDLIGEVLPIPSATPLDVLGLLTMEDAAVLDGEAQAVQKLLMPNFEPNPDPASPTRPSGV